jgi:hypothetical protein
LEWFRRWHRYWILTSAFLGHAQAQVLHDSIISALAKDDIPVTKIIHLGCDGPNVNKSLVDKLNATLQKLQREPLVDIGTFNVHKLHNGFHAGITSVEETWGIEEFFIDIYVFFKKYPSRSQDFYRIQEEFHAQRKAFKRFVSNRWLSVGPVCDRAIENWPHLLEYFLKSDHAKSIKESPMFARIASKLQLGNVMLARLHFISSIANLFEPCLEKLQTTSTMIHVLLDELSQVIQQLLQRFVKAEAIDGKTIAELKHVSLDSRSIDRCDFGIKTKEVIRKLKKDKNPTVALLEKDMLKFLQTSAKYLLDRLPLANPVLSNMRCLKPSARNDPLGVDLVVALVKHMPKLSNNIHFLDNIRSEWRLYSADSDIGGQLSGTANDVVTIDQYWSHVLKLKDAMGQPKYPNLMLIVKPALSLSHGQADVERGFSLKKRIACDSRVSLNQKTITALRTVREVWH